MSNVPTNSFTGQWSLGANNQPASNCDINSPGQYANQRCGISQSWGSAGAALNQQGGGVYAVNWNPESGIKMWFFPRNRITQDIQNGNPNIWGWGKPFANFLFGGNCPSNKFIDHQIVFNIALCSDWAGSVFPQMCPGKKNCVDFARQNFWEFNEAYWIVNYLRVYSPQ